VRDSNAGTRHDPTDMCRRPTTKRTKRQSGSVTKWGIRYRTNIGSCIVNSGEVIGSRKNIERIGRD